MSRVTLRLGSGGEGPHCLKRDGFAASAGVFGLRLTVPTIRLDTVISAPTADCFDLSLSVDAHTASMGPSGERAVGGTISGRMALRETVTWSARHFGIPFRMTSVISAYDRPRRFVDEQVTGPFRDWWHEHTFVELTSGETLMVDNVRFRSPVGPVGAVVDRLALNRYMTALLRQRNVWLKHALEGDKP